MESLKKLDALLQELEQTKHVELEHDTAIFLVCHRIQVEAIIVIAKELVLLNHQIETGELDAGTQAAS